MIPRAEHELPGELRKVLDDLRRQIRRYVFLEGVCLVVAVLCGLFWVTFFADWAYFHVSRLELPSWFRVAAFIVILCSLAAGVLVWIIARLLRGFRTRALALVLEKRFPDLDDRLITAVELVEYRSAKDPVLSSAMKQQTLRDATNSVRGLNLSDVFNRRPINRAVFTAVLLFVSVAGFGMANAAAVGRWYQAFVLGEDHYWDPFRRNSLAVAIVSQPGERKRVLTQGETFRHPRGADLVVRVDVPEGKEVPETVTLHYRTLGASDGGGGRVTMTQVGDRGFRHVLSRAVDDHHLWVVGGDFTNRVPYLIDVVDPPAIDRIMLHCDYPDYTGMDAFADQSVPVQGSQVSLPLGTRFRMVGESNKPLVGLRLRCPEFTLSLARPADEDSHRIEDDQILRTRFNVQISEDNSLRSIELPGQLVDDWLDSSATRFELPLVVSPDAATELAMAQKADLPIPIPPDVPLHFELFDADGIQTAEPVRLTIHGIVDLPPAVESRLRGIGRSITRLAAIPIEGTITDDYGVISARFGYRIDEMNDYEFVDLSHLPTGQKQFEIGGSESPAGERFAVRPLELSLGQRLAVSVFAGDADDITGPHESQGEVFTFTVVSSEDLLAQLYDKEMNLRQRFEQIIAEVQETRHDLTVQRERSMEARRLRTEASTNDASVRSEVSAVASALDAAVDRRLNAVRKNHTETRSIEELFGDIRAEMINNRVDTQTMLERIDEGIVAPLHQINEIDYPEVDQNLALVKLVNEDDNDAVEEIDATLLALDTMLSRMQEVLREMRRRETFNELVKRLQSILETQQQIRDETNRARMKSLIDGQFDFGDTQ